MIRRLVRARVRGAATLLVPLAFGGMPLHAQEVRTAVAPDTGSVGTQFRVAVRVASPAGTQVVFPDTLPVSDTIENAATRRVQMDTVGGVPSVTAIYTVAAWKPGTFPLPPISVSIREAGAERSVRAVLPPIRVRSVLPADTAGIRPKPDRDVVGADWLRWPFVVLAVLLLALIALLVWWWVRRRRRRRGEAPDVHVPPREWALQQLDELRGAGLIEAGEYKVFYGRLTEVLRRYLARLDDRWSADLTTSELASRMRFAGVADDAGIGELLARADLVKFARRRTNGAEAETSWRAAHEWVAAFSWPPQPTAAEAEAA